MEIKIILFWGIVKKRFFIVFQKLSKENILKRREYLIILKCYWRIKKKDLRIIRLGNIGLMIFDKYFCNGVESMKVLFQWVQERIKDE